MSGRLKVNNTCDLRLVLTTCPPSGYFSLAIFFLAKLGMGRRMNTTELN